MINIYERCGRAGVSLEAEEVNGPLISTDENGGAEHWFINLVNTPADIMHHLQ